MSTNWVSDINMMHQKYGVHKWIKTATPFQLKKFIEFRLDFIKDPVPCRLARHTGQDERSNRYPPCGRPHVCVRRGSSGEDFYVSLATEG